MENRTLLGLILAATATPGCGERFEGLACVDVDEDATTCPAAEDVDHGDLFVPWDCDDTRVASIQGAGELTDVSYGYTTDSGAVGDLACCYDAELVDPKPGTDCAIGRPWKEGGRPRLAPTVPRDGWGHAEPTTPADPARARAWADAAEGEHASVAAFARLSLELMAHGAPAALLRETLTAGREEVDHAEVCWEIAGRLGGRRVGAGDFPFGGPPELRRPLAEVAAEAVVEGCVAETLGAVLARVAGELAPEPEIRRAFALIAEDESRHAVLSWRIVAWAVRAGGPEVRAAVAAAFRRPAPPFDLQALALRAGVPADRLTAALPAALDEVVRPAARALLAA